MAAVGGWQDLKQTNLFGLSYIILSGMKAEGYSENKNRKSFLLRPLNEVESVYRSIFSSNRPHHQIQRNPNNCNN